MRGPVPRLAAVLSTFDDHSVHCAIDPVPSSSSADADAFARYTFAGSGPGVSFAATLALYPVREIVDGALTIVRAGRQHTVRASGRLTPAAPATQVGPLRVEVVEPRCSLRLVLDDDADLGVAADLTFTATDSPHALPARPARRTAVPTFDLPTMTQPGTWSGSIVVDDDQVRIDEVAGVRDRVWGARPFGDQPLGAPRRELPQLFWLRLAVPTARGMYSVAVAEDAQGRRWINAVHGPDGPLPTPAPAPDRTWRDARVAIEWIPGTRRWASLDLALHPWQGDAVHIAVRPDAGTEALARALGYADPVWAHATWKDELAIGRESWAVAALDPTDVRHLHRWTWGAATVDGSATGPALVEVLAVGPHEPSGLTGFTDGARP